MNTKTINGIYLPNSNSSSKNFLQKIWESYIGYADKQQPNRMLWFFLSLMINGVFFLASPAILIWMFNAPITVLAITVVTFFANLIANMGGAGIRTTLSFFYLGLIINIACILYYLV